MLKTLSQALTRDWNIPPAILSEAIAAELALEKEEAAIETRTAQNSLKVLAAFQKAGIQELHMQTTHGYGYFDRGREALDTLFATIFKAEDALVRPQFVSGTHALRAALFGLLRPGDEVVVIPETPYDTLYPVFGLRKTSGSLMDWGVRVKPTPLPDLRNVVSRQTKVLFLQRSKGYAWRPSIPIAKLKSIIEEAKSLNPALSVIVDNCYGEFVEEQEPCEVGADLVAGSLIKNPGGGLAPTGAYLAGKHDAIERAADALMAPGLGKEVGPMLGFSRLIFMGILQAPRLVGEALKTACFAALLCKRLGYGVLPEPGESRTDIIQAIELGSPEKVLAFAKGVQSAGPIEAGATPEEAPMAGYESEIVMAGGTFVQGGSLELSCDAPMRPPYHLFLQGGLSAVHGKLGVLLALAAISGVNIGQERILALEKE